MDSVGIPKTLADKPIVMTQTLSKYHSRLPRYILQPQDNTFIRVAGPRQVPWEEGTEIKNLSLSGLAFTAPMDLCPSVGEVIKIQFDVPGAQQMACFGLVTRLEPLDTNEMLVGVQFQKLEMPHRIVLLQGLAQKLKEQQKRSTKTSFWNWKRVTALAPVILMLIVLGFSWILIYQVWQLRGF